MSGDQACLLIAAVGTLFVFAAGMVMRHYRLNGSK